MVISASFAALSLSRPGQRREGKEPLEVLGASLVPIPAIALAGWAYHIVRSLLKDTEVGFLAPDGYSGRGGLMMEGYHSLRPHAPTLRRYGTK